jgi:SMI1 / KNR4 family (SUKH-1)
MTEADVARIESELGVTLPAHYREFVLAYPRSLRDARFEYNQEPASASFLFEDPQLVIDYNKGMREPGLLVTDSETAPWPGEYLIIGTDVGGNCWCVKLTGRSKAVWLFEHEEGVFQRQSQSLAEHERYALEFIEEFNRE